ncbi:MAG: YggT family protein [Candidatus Saccharimonadales bacterium]
MADSPTSANVTIPGFLRISKVIAYVLYAWVIIGVVSLVLRVFLLLFSANQTTPFVKFVYNVSYDYLAPFRGIFPPRPVGETGYLDVAALFAIIIYLFLMWGFSALVQYVQHKIDVSRYEQEKEIARLKLEREKARLQESRAT